MRKQYLLLFNLFLITYTYSKTTITFDSASFVSPTLYSNLLEEETTIEIVPKCSVKSITIYSIFPKDTLAIIFKSPFRTKWNTGKINPADQMRIQLGYSMIHSSGDTIISPPTPHRWLKYNKKESLNKKAISPVLEPEERIVIDGNLKEWRRVPTNFIDSNSFFQSRWSSSDFYIAVTVKDNKISPQDQVEISIDMKPSKELFFGINQRIFIYGPSRRSFVLAVDRTPEGPIQNDSIIIRVGEEMEWRSHIKDTTYTIECRIPFVLLSDLEFPPKTFGFDVSIIDEKGNIKSWNAQNPDTRQIKVNWGKITLKQNFFPLKFILLSGLGLFSILLIFSLLINFISKAYSHKKIYSLQFSKLLQEILLFIETNHSKKNLSIEETAEYAGVSVNHLSKIFKEEMDSNFENITSSIRVKNSKKLLTDLNLEMEDIAFQCGFSSYKEFETHFERFMKTTPQIWRDTRDYNEEDDEETDSMQGTQ